MVYRIWLVSRKYPYSKMSWNNSIVKYVTVICNSMDGVFWESDNDSVAQNTPCFVGLEDLLLLSQ